MPDRTEPLQEPGGQPTVTGDPGREALGLAMLRRLAQGEPLALDTLASDTGQAVEAIRAELLRHGDIEYDHAGRIVGNGITLRPTPHRFEIDGRELYTWCALDTLAFPAMLGVSARAESPCHATGQPIHVDVEPDRISSVEPASAVVSIVPRPQAASIRASFCNHVHFFADVDVALPWLAEHPDASIVPVADAQTRGRELIESLPAVGASCPDDCCDQPDKRLAGCVRAALTVRERQEYLDGIATGLTLEQLSAPIETDPAAGVLDRLRAAAATANELRGLGDELLDRYVQAARADGASWSEIGTALGVTKQAAHERFVDSPLAWPQNFNQPARAVVARALKEARGFGHRYLGTEHLLLALSAEPGLARTTLAELGVSEHQVRESIEQIIGRGNSDSATLGITPRTKRVLEAAVKEARRVGRQRCADPEHLLLALAANDGVARDILAQHGTRENDLRERLVFLIAPQAPEIAAKLRAPKRRGVRRRTRA
jgi:alkylmercury lyase